ncbi:MAG: ABC transporter permease [Candidatus Tectomicrobia bacterium]|uniref:ABC transporter permease n=1 Tax=Tectimicrobiota bacterium TaxID=2528274 RepID=A0A937W4R2_UNCTE|nr:ABC transporter permease [Candidatus Tectomicrobia bacterium]
MRYLIRRLLLYIPIMLAVTLMVFLLMRVIPGDPALLMLAGASGDGSFKPEDLAKLRRALGTDRPAYVQYGAWLWGLLHGDLGTSLFYRTPIIKEIAPRLPATLELSILAVLVSVLLAVPLGAVSALKQHSWLDYGARLVTFVGISIPIFVTGLVVIYLLVKLFHWFPPLGYAMLWEDPWTNVQQMLFPALTLAFFELNFTARVTRSAMLEVLREDYIRTARAKGLAEQRIILGHALKNAALPIITVSAWSLARLLGGTIIIEKIFLVPGMGTLLLDAIIARDYTLIQAIVLCYAVIVLTANLLVDLCYSWFDPRVRYA